VIYLKLTDGRHLLILEPGNIQTLLDGGNPAASPDKEVMVCYTPDPDWLKERMMERWEEVKSSPELFEKLLKKSQKRKKQ
jgi:hypothetical protein